jgi:hypothetical protein
MFGTPEYALLLAATVAVNYYAGGVIARQQNLKKRRVILGLFIALNVLVLIFLKYINFPLTVSFHQHSIFIYSFIHSFITNAVQCQ